MSKISVPYALTQKLQYLAKHSCRRQDCKYIVGKGNKFLATVGCGIIDILQCPNNKILSLLFARHEYRLCIANGSNKHFAEFLLGPERA